MKLINSKVRYVTYGYHDPYMITLHHTAGGRVGSEQHLKIKRLGYHFMIETDGTVYSYNPIDQVVGHSSKANTGYVGVSFVAGGSLGPVNELQLQASKELCKQLAEDYESITHVSDHATVDKKITKRNAKSDPQWPGEKVEQNNYVIKHKYLDIIADFSGLKAFK